MYWSEYVDALTRIKKLGRQRGINGHFQPQHLYCARVIERKNVTKVDTAQIGEFLHGLGGFGLAPAHYPVDLKTHGTARKHLTSSWDLCELARPEYTALGRPFPAECKDRTRH